MNYRSLLEDVEKRNYIFENNDEQVKNIKNEIIQKILSKNNKQYTDVLLNLSFDSLENALVENDKEKLSVAREVILDFSNLKDKNLPDKTVENLLSQYITLLTTPSSVKDDLKKYLSEQTDDTFYYIGINQFVSDYYNSNQNSEWKIRAVLQVGFPFEFGDKNGNSIFGKKNRQYLESKKWSLFVFTRKPFSTITIGFDNRNTFANLNSIKNLRNDEVEAQLADLSEENRNKLFAVLDYITNSDRPDIINNFLAKNKAPHFSNAECDEYGYSFTEIPAEYFRIDYLDYLSRYKRPVIEVFGYPEEKEKIIRLKNIVEFINVPGKKYKSQNNRDSNVLIEDFFFQDNRLKPKVRIGEQDTILFSEDYEVRSYLKDISPYYLYCLLTSEFISDYYAERYESDNYYNYGSSLPLEDCVFFEMDPKKMSDKKYQEKYERDINPKTKAHAMIEVKNFSNQNAKESMEKYLAEIHNDIAAGSFYSATILMGSVLEAFLIDWLSEIDGKDYFQEDYMIVDKKYKYPRRADLKDYIDEIQKKKPDWIDGAKKATEIRRKRNLVHAKLYIAEGEVSQDICYEMLQNLEVIINNRWNEKK